MVINQESVRACEVCVRAHEDVAVSEKGADARGEIGASAPPAELIWR